MMKRISYSTLTSRHKENYNFAKVSALLADYGFTTMRLSDDWRGADFIAHHPSGRTLFVQLKSRLTINRKYSRQHTGRDIHICFPTVAAPRQWFLYRHDNLAAHMVKIGAIGELAWRQRGGQSRKHPSRTLLAYLIRTGCSLGFEGAT